MKNFRKKTFVVALLLGSLMHQSCELFISQVCKDEELTIKREDNNSGKIRLDGYYYDTYFYSKDSNFVSLLLLFRNGISQDRDLNKRKNVEIGNIELDNSELRKNFKNTWGVYKIEGDNIEIQAWTPSTTCSDVSIAKGKILSDTTIKINDVKLSNGKQISTGEAIFKFRPYSPKPDSVVSFIK